MFVAIAGVLIVGVAYLCAVAGSSYPWVDVVKEPLRAPSPATEKLSVQSRVYRRSNTVPLPEGRVALEPSYDVVVELHPSGRWRYAWRDCGAPDDAWHELHGTWKSALGSGWLLVPDDPAAALDPEDLVEGEFPLLSWGPTVASSGDSPDAAIGSGNVRKGACCYVVPLVDRESGRFTKDVVAVPDPRGR